jgi:hypothetical protein
MERGVVVQATILPVQFSTPPLAPGVIPNTTTWRQQPLNPEVFASPFPVPDQQFDALGFVPEAQITPPIVVPTGGGGHRKPKGGTRPIWDITREAEARAAAAGGAPAAEPVAEPAAAPPSAAPPIGGSADPAQLARGFALGRDFDERLFPKAPILAPELNRKARKALRRLKRIETREAFADLTERDEGLGHASIDITARAGLLVDHDLGTAAAQNAIDAYALLSDRDEASAHTVIRITARASIAEDKDEVSAHAETNDDDLVISMLEGED